MGKRCNGSGQRLYRQVVEEILKLVDSGEYPVGTRLPAERELSERFSVSRPTIREAIIALEAQGCVAVRTGSGVYVLERVQHKGFGHNVSPFELMETRVLIEGEAAALAASMITDEQLEALKQALDEMEQENKKGDIESDNADREFHSIIAQATNNGVLMSTIESLWDTQEGLYHLKIAHQQVCMADPQIRLDEHRAIYDALAVRDPQSARVAMRQHFTRGISALHDATEEEAVEVLRRKLNEKRERFSMNRFVSGVTKK